jgi:tRNA 2-thiouridine synthesizing protein A
MSQDTGEVRIDAGRTVEDITREHPGAREAMARLGINHCCGAHLTLAEAAAAAGVSLDTLVATLAPVSSSIRLDVRGLEPPQPMVRVLQEAERLEPGAELEVHHDRRPTFLYPQLDDRGFVHETDEPEPGLVRIRIRRRAAP